jgi:hypothetical protein
MAAHRKRSTQRRKLRVAAAVLVAGAVVAGGSAVASARTDSHDLLPSVDEFGARQAASELHFTFWLGVVDRVGTVGEALEPRPADEAEDDECKPGTIAAALGCPGPVTG